MINLAYKGINQGSNILWHRIHNKAKQQSQPHKLGVRMLQMYLHPLDDTSHEAQCSGATQIRPTPDQAGLVTHRDLLAQARPWRNAGTQVFWPCSTLPASSTFPLSQPWLASPQLHNLLSLAIHTKTSISVAFPARSPFLLSTQA